MAWNPFFQLQSIATTPGFEAETLTYIAAMSVPPSDARARLINDLIKALKTAGVWTLLDVLYLLAAHDAQTARLNVKNPAAFALTAVASPTFTTDRGYAGNGSSSYLNTNFVPSTDAVRYTLNSAHIGLWSRTNAASATVAIGARGASSNDQGLLIIRNSSGAFDYRVNVPSTGGALTGSISTDSSGHFVIRRTSSTAVAVFRNAVSLNAASDTSGAVPPFAVFLGALNNAGTAASFNAYQFSAAHLGSGLSDQNITDLYNAIQTYMTAVGA